MPAPVGPYTLPAIGQALTVPVPPGQYTQVVIDNASPFTCGVNIAGPQRWLAAFTSDLYDMDPGATVTVSPVAALTGASSDQTLTATFYRADETPEGSYPVSLTSQAIVAALTLGSTVGITGTVPISAAAALPVSGTVGVSGTVSTSGTSTVAGIVGVSAVNSTVNTLNQQALLASGTFTSGVAIAPINVPAWCRRVLVIAQTSGVTSPATVASIIVQGQQSNLLPIYWLAGSGAEGSVIVGGSVYGSVDSSISVQITLTAGGSTTRSYWVVAIEQDNLYGSPNTVQNEQVTAWDYCDGTPDIAVSAAMPGGLVSEPLIPFPQAGFLVKITGLQYQCAGTAGYFFVGPSGGTRFKQVTVAANTSVDVPCSLTAATAIVGNSSVAGTIYATYKFVPILR